MSFYLEVGILQKQVGWGLTVPESWLQGVPVSVTLGLVSEIASC